MKRLLVLRHNTFRTNDNDGKTLIGLLSEYSEKDIAHILGGKFII